MKNRLSGKTGFVGLILILQALPCSVSLAPAASPITPSGLNTQVTLSATPPPGKIQYDITGGTRPGGGLNLFHSFGNFNVPTNNIANFLNAGSVDLNGTVLLPNLPTANILGRINGGNPSSIFGMIQTNGPGGFPTANLFLMNPNGFLFGPTATINVGGMVSFTSADYLRLADGARFNAVPHAHADALLSMAPVAAFGFLGSNPGAITVQGSQLTVAEGTGISLVGGNITVQGGTLTAPSGQINLVSVGKPSHPHVGGEVTNGAGFVATGFKSLGAITVSNGSTIDTSGIADSGHPAGSISIRGGQFVMDDSAIKANQSTTNLSQINGNIDVTANQVILSNSSVDTGTRRLADQGPSGSTGNITFNVETFSATDSSILTTATVDSLGGSTGAVTIQGLKGAGTSADSVSLNSTTVATLNSGLSSLGGPPDAGPILIRADNITLNTGSLSAFSKVGNGGAISLVSRGSIEVVNALITSEGQFGASGTINLRAGGKIDLTSAIIDASSLFIAGTINLTGSKAVSLTNGTVLNADNGSIFGPPPNPNPNPNGGTIHIDGGAKFTSDHSTISADSRVGNGGTIQIGAKTVDMTATQVTTATSGGPQTVGGTITVDAKKVTLDNSQVLSTATEGHGGTIGITTHNLNTINSVIDATSQTGTDGTVTINGVIQP